MVRRFNGDTAVSVVEVAKGCPGVTLDHMWPLLGAFEAYTGVVLNLFRLRYVQVRRGEYCSAEDTDALHDACKEYDEVERQVEIEEEEACATRNESKEGSNDEQSPYDALTLDNVRKVCRRPPAPKRAHTTKESATRLSTRAGEGGGS